MALRLALGHALASIATPNPSTVLRLADIAARRGDDLLRAVHDGTLGAAELEPIPSAGMTGLELRAALTAALHSDPRRAALLEAVRKRRGRLVLGDCWPELSLVACWLGGSAGDPGAPSRRGIRPAGRPARSRARRQRGAPHDSRRRRLRGGGPRGQHELLRVHRRGGHGRSGASHAPVPRARRRTPLRRDRDRGQRTLPLRHERRRGGPRISRAHAQGGVRPQGPGHAEHHRREAPSEPRPARGEREPSARPGSASGSSA